MKAFITEKTVNLAKSGKFTVVFVNGLNKKQIVDELKKKYSVDALKVNILNQKPVKKTKKGKATVDRGFTKAIITLKEGQKIPGFEIIEEEKKAQEKKSKEDQKKKKSVKETAKNK